MAVLGNGMAERLRDHANPSCETVSRQDRLSAAAGVLLASLVLLVLFVWYAEPITDGDLWFHLAYGRYMLEHKTLIPDHSIFSWTPVDNSSIYCAWIPQILLYVLYKAGSLPVLFALRYAAYLVFVALVGIHAKKHSVALHPLTWLVCLVGLLMATPASIIKPELFSFVLMGLTCSLWFSLKRTAQPKMFYVFPVIMAVWVNTHGGVIFGAFFLLLVATGEAANILFAPGNALPAPVRGHFFLSVLLSLFAFFLTPYGVHYPRVLFSDLVVNAGTSVGEFLSVGAYQSIFHPMARWQHYVEYMVFAVFLMVVLCAGRWKRAGIDWSLVLSNVGMAILYCQFIRTTYYWAIVFTLSAVSIIHQGPSWLVSPRKRMFPLVTGAVVLLGLLVAGEALIQAQCRPMKGFGISHYNPVEEAEFIREHFRGLRLGNDYDSGSYLLWALYPETRVFIDARYFPYKPWYREYMDFLYGKDLREKDAFVDKYKADIWCLLYDFPQMPYFLSSGRFSLVHMGPSACIFARKDLGVRPGLSKVSPSVMRVDAFQAVKIILFCVKAREIQSACSLADTLEKSLTCRKKNAAMSGALTALGFTLLMDGRDFDAQRYLNKALEIDDRQGAAFKGLALAASRGGRYQQAMLYLKRWQDLEPSNPEVYYNMACVLAKTGRGEEAVDMLRVSREKGFADRRLLETDPDLDPIRDRSDFQALLR